MSERDPIETAPDPVQPQSRPRLVLMGEFSAGKSTLANLLLGGPMLPTQVTATRLPPVHVTQGNHPAYALTPAGERREIDITDLSDLTPDNAASIHLEMQSDTLELCDLVDMPGISDPNMASDTWDEVLTRDDHVVWCTHATQAWRQSEAALWDRLRGATSGANLLLITQFDKLRSPRDKSRVLARVERETEGMFSAIYPISLIDALAAGDDFEAWKACGAHDFMEHLVDILLNRGDTAERLVGAAVKSQSRARSQTPASPAVSTVGPDAAVLRPGFEAPAATPAHDAAPAAAASGTTGEGAPVRIVPRRVRAKEGGSKSARPTRAEAEAMYPPPGSGAA